MWYRSIFLSPVLQHLSELVEEFWEGLENKVGSSGVLLAKIVGLFPLVNVVFIGDIIVIMVIVSLSHFDIEESDAPGESSQVAYINILLAEVIENLDSLGVLDFQDLWLGDSSVVAAIADGSRVVVRVELVKEHRTGYVNNYR